MARGDAFQLELELDGKRFGRAARGLGVLAQRMGVAVGDLTPIARQEIENVLDTVIAAMRQRHSKKWAPGQRLPTGDKTGQLARRSGRGIDNLEVVTTVSENTAEGRILVPFPLSVHETGATIRSRGKLLAIPLPAALDSNGIPKKPGPRAWRDTFVAKSRNGNLLIFQKKGLKITPLYVLKKRVRIPRRLGLGVTLTKAAPLFVDRLFLKAVQELKSVRVN